ncbi:MAG: ATP-binding cassette domain-containing protein [Bacteroidetes bacterium]|nr:ATP-binding cassette domain-containing protein [Bacteroidota bacterium]
MIESVNISKSFNGRPVLKNISLLFEQGKTNLVIGESGSGKTVLLKCLVGLFEIDEGQVLFGNRIFSDAALGVSEKAKLKDERQKIRQELGMLFQGGALFDSMSVLENVMFPMRMFTDMKEPEMLERAHFCLKRVKLSDAAKLQTSELSGGMKKRTAIARAIALNPQYLLCDEPNSGLDPQTAVVIDDLIQEITKEYNITTIINTHDMNSVMEIGEKVVFIYEGKKWWEGTNREILFTNNRELNDFVYAYKSGRGM